MPRTETYDLQDELDRIDDELDDLADEAAALDEDETIPDGKRTRVQQLQRQYAGLAWALNEDEGGDDRARDPYERVTLTELTAGAYLTASAEMEQDIQNADVAAGRDTERLYRVAKAVESADFVPDGADFSQTFIQVARLKPHFFFWLEQRVDDLTTPAVEGNDFARRVEERQSNETSDSPTDG